MAGILFVFASDTGDLETATQAVKMRQIGTDLEISRHIPAGGDVLLEPAVEFAAKVRTANAKIAANPSEGFEDDIVDDPTVAIDPKRIEYTEAVVGGSDDADAEVHLRDSAKVISVAPQTAIDIDAALVLLGL